MLSHCNPLAAMSAAPGSPGPAPRRPVATLLLGLLVLPAMAGAAFTVARPSFAAEAEARSTEGGAWVIAGRWYVGPGRREAVLLDHASGPGAATPTQRPGDAAIAPPDDKAPSTAPATSPDDPTPRPRHSVTPGLPLDAAAIREAGLALQVVTDAHAVRLEASGRTLTLPMGRRTSRTLTLIGDADAPRIEIDGEAAPELRGAWIAMIRLGAPRRLEIALVGARYGTLRVAAPHRAPLPLAIPTPPEAASETMARLDSAPAAAAPSTRRRASRVVQNGDHAALLPSSPPGVDPTRIPRPLPPASATQPRVAATTAPSTPPPGATRPLPPGSSAVRRYPTPLPPEPGPAGTPPRAAVQRTLDDTGAIFQWPFADDTPDDMEPRDPWLWRLQVRGGVQTVTARYYRGILQANEGGIIQLDAAARVILYDKPQAPVFQQWTVDMGLETQNYFGPNGGERPVPNNVKFVELYWWGGMSTTLFQRWTVSLYPTQRTITSGPIPPIDGDVHGVDLRIAFNDATRKYPWRLNPYVVVSSEYENNSDRGDNDGDRVSFYLELGLEPEYVLVRIADRVPLTLRTPIRAGFSLKDYYESPVTGESDFFGFFQAGLELSLPVAAFAADAAGRAFVWEATAGVHVIVLGESAEDLADRNTVMGGDRVDLIGVLGIEASY